MPRSSKKKTLTRKQRFIAVVTKPFVNVKRWVSGFLTRRPHRSFRLTKRRDYRRSLKLPGFIAFTQYVSKTLWQYRRTFIWLAAIYAVLTIVLVGIGSQETYTTLTSTLKDTTSDIFQGNIGQLGQAAIVFLSIGASGLTGTLTESQQIYFVLLGLMIWLTTVWLLRNMLAGHKVKMRDGLYSAGSPIIATFLVVLVMIVQLIPLGIAVVAYSAATATGLLAGGVEAMLFWFAAALLTIMSLYWITSSFIAMIIVTLPGMYPGKALRTAGDMVVGRRTRILFRILWMFGVIAVAGAIFLIPVILIDSLLTNLWSAISAVPVVPIALMFYTIVAFIWSTSYIYLLYRRIVDDDAKPA